MEEKKDCEEKAESIEIERSKEDRSSREAAHGCNGTELEEDDDDDYDEYIEALPHGLRRIRDWTFKSQHELEEELVKRGFPDLPVEVHPKSGKAYLKITSGAHDEITSYYAGLFNDDYKPTWGVASTTNVFMQPGATQTRRKPDIAFWGPAKCHRPRRTLKPKNLVKPPKIFTKTREQVERVNPDVVVKISWGNAEPYEFDAINELMNHALVTYPHAQPNNQAPSLGVLIKIRVSNKRDRDDRKIIRRVDVYRLPHGTTVTDAIANQNGASYNAYVPGGTDVVVQITAADLRVPNNTGGLAPFEMSAKEIYEILK
jgi:hypothetical protein